MLAALIGRPVGGEQRPEAEQHLLARDLVDRRLDGRGQAGHQRRIAPAAEDDPARLALLREPSQTPPARRSRASPAETCRPGTRCRRCSPRRRRAGRRNRGLGEDGWGATRRPRAGRPPRPHGRRRCNASRNSVSSRQSRDSLPLMQTTIVWPGRRPARDLGDARVGEVGVEAEQVAQRHAGRVSASARIPPGPAAAAAAIGT